MLDAEFLEARAIREHNREVRRKQVKRMAADIGVRPAAKALGLSPDTITRDLYLSGAKAVSPHEVQLTLFAEDLDTAASVYLSKRPIGFFAKALVSTRTLYGKNRKRVEFSVAVKGHTLREAMDSLLSQIEERTKEARLNRGSQG